MKDPEAILKAFKQRADEVSRRIAELRLAQEKALQDQVDALRSIETAYDSVADRQDIQTSAGPYARRALEHAAHLREVAEHLALQEDKAREELHERFADQKRFETFLSIRQRKAKALERRREEADLVELANLFDGHGG